jgi:DNA-binding IclR family transcriptional regulator
MKSKQIKPHSEIEESANAERNSLLERQLAVIEAVSGARDGLYLSEIADWVGIPRPTAHRIVAALVGAGMLATRELSRKVFLPGPRLNRLTYSGIDEGLIQRTALPEMTALAEAFRQTVFMARFNGYEILSVAMFAPEREWRGHVDPGDRFAPHAAASAKAILAFQTPATIDRVIKEPLVRFTPRTKTDMTAVNNELEQVREQGHAICDQELSLGIIAIACPVLLPDTDVVFSLAITGPLSEFSLTPRGKIIEALKTSASRIALLIERFGRSGKHLIQPDAALSNTRSHR